MNAFAFENLQLLLDVRLTSAESIQFLNHQRIAAPENLLFQILIALTLSVFAGAFVHNDIVPADAIICESLDLSVLVLFPAGNTGIAKCSVFHKNTSELSQKVLPLLERPKSQKRTFWHRFLRKKEPSQKVHFLERFFL